MLIKYLSLRARMLVKKDIEAGKTRSQGVTALTNRMNFWRWDHDLPPWHQRKTRQITKMKGTIPSGRSKKGKFAPVSIPNLTIESMQIPDSSGPESVKWDDFDD